MFTRYPSLKDISWDVVIVGGGISGYTAAFTLLEREPTLNIVVIEAQDRIGGRVYSVPLQAAYGRTYSFDLGGQWVCRRQTELFNLLNKLQIQVVDRDTSGKVIINFKGKRYYKTKLQIFDVCNILEMSQMIRFIRKIEYYCSKLTLNQLASESELCHLDLVDMETFINKYVSSVKVKCILHDAIMNHCGAAASDITVLFYVVYCLSTEGIINHMMDTKDGLDECWIKNGAQQICDKIEEEIGENSNVRRETVTDVLLTEYYVTVKTNVDTYLTYAAIVAVPPEDLREIHFSPSLYKTLPTVPQGILRSRIVKFVVTYATEFWKKLGFSGEIYVLKENFEEDTLYSCHNISFDDCAALTGYLISKDYTAKSETQFKATVLKKLAEYFGSDALEPIDYADVVWSYGPTLNYCIEIMDKLKVMTRTRRTIYLAGSETSLKWYGCIAGAVESGKRAAIEVLYTIRPGILTVDDIIFVEPARRARTPKMRRYRKMWLEVIFSARTYLLVSVITLGCIFARRYIPWIGRHINFN